MNKLRQALPLLCACALGLSTSGSLQAAATAYKLTDLGSYGTNDRQPGSGRYSAPQVDDSGAVHYGTGRTDAGGYHFESVGALSRAEYSKSGSQPTQLLPPLSMGFTAYSMAEGINAAGTAVGFLNPNVQGAPDISTAFVSKPADGPSLDLRSPAGLSTIPGAYPGTVAWYALGINVSGMIVGVTPPAVPPITSFFNDFAEGRAMLSDGKTTVDLNTLIAPGSGFLLTSASSINDLGQIAGYATDLKDGTYHAYLLTPDPRAGAAGPGLHRVRIPRAAAARHAWREKITAVGLIRSRTPVIRIPESFRPLIDVVGVTDRLELLRIPADRTHAPDRFLL